MLLLWLFSLGASGNSGDERYRDEIESWRQKRLADLKAEDGWLSVTGLYWLRPGETGRQRPEQRPPAAGSASRLGRHARTLSDGKVEFRPAPGSPSPATASRSRAGRIYSDADEQPGYAGALAT